MNGELVSFDDETQTGMIRASDGKTYSFPLGRWKGRGLPAPGVAVRFDVRDGQALHVFNAPVAQREAAHARSASGDVIAKAYSHWAIVAVVVAILGLFFDRLAPFVEIVAAICALAGLRQIRQAPQRYKGRTFCWGAIVLALIIALMAMLIEAPPAAAMMMGV
ncbi:hypothetical protein GCM10027040_23600 [Halomonas shantousis]